MGNQYDYILEHSKNNRLLVIVIVIVINKKFNFYKIFLSIYKKMYKRNLINSLL